MKRAPSVFAALTFILITCSPPVLAQQITGTPGSPGATTTIDGKQLPPPDPKFGGVIKEKASDSKPWWAPRVVPPKGAPNVLLIMTDDCGFGAPSTFGGVIPTPALDRIANAGLRYTNFHSTSLCSPTRAALITGRNHHVGWLWRGGRGGDRVPGLRLGHPQENGTIGRILKENGYATSWFGKNHNTPFYQRRQAGPFDQWPIGMGFEYFYGFVGGDASQWQPNLFRNTTAIYPFQGNPDWNLTTAMADEAIQHMKEIKELAPDKPFFVYYVPGGTHAPHHPTKEWIKKISDMHLFDDGWNKLRETIFANQKRLGIMPANAQLTAWPKAVCREWDSLGWEEKKLFIKQADVYGAYLAYTGSRNRPCDPGGRGPRPARQHADHLHQRRQRRERRRHAQRHAERIHDLQRRARAGEGPVPLVSVLGLGADLPALRRRLGVGDGHAVPMVKQVASHFGGTSQGVCMSWPGHIKDVGGIRRQFHHVIDIVPTILEVTGIPAPDTIDGIKQRPIEGVSMVYTWDKANANAPTKHTTQYFEMLGNRAIYHEGWVAATTPVTIPWELSTKRRRT